MFALCIESSNARGMGHFFRSMVLADALRVAGRSCKYYINDHEPSLRILRERGLMFEVVPLLDPQSPWEAAVVHKDGVTVWINDRHRTDAGHTARLKALDLSLVTFDDRGTGAVDADLHIAGLAFDPTERLYGKRVLRGLDYVILNPEIERYRRLRHTAGRMIVTLGAADTYGATVEIVRHLGKIGREATVVVGPAFRHHAELAAVATPAFAIKCAVPSLIEELSHHDLAVTGGGVTPLEALASGLPCIVVANEPFEIPVGRALQKEGCALFAGHYSEMDPAVFMRELQIETMSRIALDRIGLDGTRRVVEALLAL